MLNTTVLNYTVLNTMVLNTKMGLYKPLRTLGSILKPAMPKKASTLSTAKKTAPRKLKVVRTFITKPSKRREPAPEPTPEPTPEPSEGSLSPEFGEGGVDNYAPQSPLRRERRLPTMLTSDELYHDREMLSREVVLKGGPFTRTKAFEAFDRLPEDTYDTYHASDLIFEHTAVTTSMLQQVGAHLQDTAAPLNETLLWRAMDATSSQIEMLSDHMTIHGVAHKALQKVRKAARDLTVALGRREDVIAEDNKRYQGV